MFPFLHPFLTSMFSIFSRSSSVISHHSFLAWPPFWYNRK
nr:MAG TPA: hypothetical protein [Caudoviricetes sp.]